jgi:trk system potassium uptake protein TrkH
MLFSLMMLMPVIVAVIYGEDTVNTFVTAFGITLATGAVCWFAHSGETDLRSREGFLITVLFYLSLGLFGALPIYLAPGLTESFTDAAFESFSGLTTTGATVITGLDELPRSILFYRQLLQWLGGMGIIVLAVAILPMLGVGGMQLYRAESPGTVKDAKLTPRIKETAKALWFIYLALTASCAIAYWFAGMSLFDAICHSFSTVAIGGFSTHDASFGYFASQAIESVAIVFMIISGINFGLHFFAWRNPMRYLNDIEVRTYLTALVVISALVVWSLSQAEGSTARPLRDGIFQAISITTTTGFTTVNFSLWPSFAPILLIFAAFVGGCAGSTAGGIKVMRAVLIAHQGLREIRRLIHPHGVFPVKLGPEIIPDKIVDAVWGFFAAYIIIFLTLVCILLGISDLDFVTAYSAVSACLNNLGPGLGSVALNYADLPDPTKCLLVLAMLLGRLEIFTVLVLLTPAYWRS